jgi:hypothetical protein
MNDEIQKIKEKDSLERYTTEGQIKVTIEGRQEILINQF